MSEAYIGEIRIFAGNFAPQNWNFCDGSLKSIAENSALFSLIGTTYGGDGHVTFALPDLRGRVAMGMGQGNGLSNRIIGESFGTESVTLTLGQIPHHNHAWMASTSTTDLSSPESNLLATTTSEPLYDTTTDPSKLRLLMASACSNTGNYIPHGNLMPSLAVNYIICLFGLFPSRN